MRKKRIMVIGPSQSGKTTLVNLINNQESKVLRTQDVIYGINTIDVPGAYIENSWMYKHLIAIAQDASHILFLVDQTNPVDIYPPGLANAFTCPVLGVITKVDTLNLNIERCIAQLKKAGAQEPYFKISSSDANSFKSLKQILIQEQRSKGESI